MMSTGGQKTGGVLKKERIPDRVASWKGTTNRWDSRLSDRAARASLFGGAVAASIIKAGAKSLYYYRPCNVVMPDARGHGNSSTHSTDIGTRITKRRRWTHPGDRNCGAVLLGPSMGGMTAAVIASQRATALRGVILADPTVLSPSVSAKFTRAISIRLEL